MTASPIRDEDGDLIGAVATFRDITEHKRLESDLSHLVERLRGVTGQLVIAAIQAQDDVESAERCMVELREATRHEA
jgi:hypothetical protein